MPMFSAFILFIRNMTNIVWFSRLRGVVKVHALPLFGGGVVGLLFAHLQGIGLVTINLKWASDQALLDAVCQLASICLTTSGGPIVVSSLMVGAGAALIFDRLYIAESPKHLWLVRAEEKAEDLLSKLPTVEPPIKPQSSTSEQAWRGDRK